MVESVNRQSSAEIMNVFTQAENAGKSVRVNDQGRVVIANFGNKIAEAFRSIGKDADWKQQRRVDTANLVVEKFSEALEREAIQSVKTNREWKIADATLQNLFKNHSEIKNNVDAGVVTPASRLKELLAEAAVTANESITHREQQLAKKTIALIKDGSFSELTDALQTKTKEELSGLIKKLHERVEAVKNLFLSEQQKYADEANPTDEQAAQLRDLGNILGQLEERVSTALAGYRESHADLWVGDTVTVPERAYDRENFSIRGEVRRAIESNVNDINDLQGFAANSPALNKLAALLDRFLTSASDLGEIVDTDGQDKLLVLAIKTQNQLEDVAAIISEENELSPADAALLDKAESLLNRLIDTADNEGAAQQVRFPAAADLDIGEAADAEETRVKLEPTGFKSRQSDAEANEGMRQRRDTESGTTEYIPMNSTSAMSLADRRVHNTSKWNDAMAAEPKADRKEFKPSDEVFVRGDTSEIDGVQDDLTPPEVLLNKDDPQPAKSNLRKS